MKRAIVLLALACCRPKAQPVENVRHDGGPRMIHVAASVMSDAKITTAPVRKEILSPTIDVVGEIVSDPDKSARVASPVAGRIEQVSFKEGSVVQRGDVLALIRIPELGRLRSAQASADVKARAARSNADRVKALRTQGLAGEQELLDAEASAQALDAEGRALGEQLAAMGTTAGGAGASLALRAPTAGTIVLRDAVLGQPVNADQTIATIADLGVVWFLGRAYENELASLRVGQSAIVVSNAVAGERFPGTITFLGKQADPSTRAVSVRIPLANPNEKLRLGLFATAHVRSDPDGGSGTPAIVVPQSAITALGESKIVFVRRGPDDFEVRDVRLGDASGDLRAITDGLREGEEIAVYGVFTLKSIALKATFAEAE